MMLITIMLLVGTEISGFMAKEAPYASRKVLQ